MASIQLNDETAARLSARASAAGMTVDDYLRSLLPVNGSAPDQLSTAEFEAEIERLSFSGPSLPADFSRADIYADHDSRSA
jgi:hypothetical protein